jgi:proteasome assembly chaperone (PAC2) family protein
MADYIEVSSWPVLRHPVMLAAFQGWNDASEVATGALRSLSQQWSGEEFATIDPEEFFDFSERRPMVVYDAEGQRQVTWPDNTFFFCHDRSTDRDFIVLVGTEPHLRWRTFTGQILGLAKRLEVSVVVTVGGLLADVAHTMPANVSGSATQSELRARLRLGGASTTRYKGPTGIVGVLQDACRRADVPAASLWGSVPHYLQGTTPNPSVQTAIMRAISDLLDLHLDFSRQEAEAARFRHQVDEAIAGNERLTAYVRSLEQRLTPEDEEPSETEDPPSPLPSGEEFVRDLEEYLRRHNRQGGQGS